jgi:hypothetical protein
MGGISDTAQQGDSRLGGWGRGRLGAFADELDRVQPKRGRPDHGE